MCRTCERERIYYSGKINQARKRCTRDFMAPLSSSGMKPANYVFNHKICWLKLLAALQALNEAFLSFNKTGFNPSSSFPMIYSSRSAPKRTLKPSRDFLPLHHCCYAMRRNWAIAAIISRSDLLALIFLRNIFLT